MENKYDIEEWVAKRSFEELTEAEKVIAIEELGSEEAYTELRKIVLSFQSEDDKVIPSSVRHNIMDAFDAHHRKSDEKIIPISKPNKSGTKKILVYALLAASILVAVFLILPQKNSTSDQQIAENKTKREMNSDSVAPAKSVEKQIEQSADSEDFEKEEKIDTELEAPNNKSREKDKAESESPQMRTENAQNYSAKSDQIYTESVENDAGADKLHEAEVQEIVKLAAPPQPVKEMRLSQDTEIQFEQESGRRDQFLSKRKNASEFTFKIESFDQNHYTSY